MKKLSYLLAVLFSFAFASSFGQDLSVTLGDIPAGIKTDGKISPSYTTSDRIIRNAKLVSKGIECEVVSYEFSITVGKNYWGPIKATGAQLTKEMINRIKETKGPGVRVFFDDIKVKLKQDGMVRNKGSLAFKYDQ